MRKPSHFYMPGPPDRTEIDRIRGMTDNDIDYSDIPKLSSRIWRGQSVPQPKAGNRPSGMTFKPP